MKAASFHFRVDFENTNLLILKKCFAPTLRRRRENFRLLHCHSRGNTHFSVYKNCSLKFQQILNQIVIVRSLKFSKSLILKNNPLGVGYSQLPGNREKTAGLHQVMLRMRPIPRRMGMSSAKNLGRTARLRGFPSIILEINKRLKIITVASFPRNNSSLRGI